MQRLARFSLLAVLVLTALLLGAWAYLVVRYGGMQEYFESGDAPRWWRPAPRNSRPEITSDNDASPRESGGVKTGTRDPREEDDWRRVRGEEPEAPVPEPAPRASTLEARMNADFTELAIETEEVTL